MANTPSILSEAARRWLGSVEGVAPQMLPARAEMAAKTGLMSFQDALMIKKLADQISGSNKDGDIPQSNVMQDKIAQISGRAPVKAPPPQMPQPQAPMPEDPRMQGGLGTLPAPTMDNAQFAGGGIVAFAGDEGSYTGDSEPIGFWQSIFMDPAEYNRRMNQRGLRGQTRRSGEMVGGQYPVHTGDPEQKPLSASEFSLDQRMAEAVKRRRDLEEAALAAEMQRIGGGSGIAIPDITLPEINVEEELGKEDYGDYDRIMAQLKADKEERGKNTEYDRRMALAAAGFKMAQAASQPGATFMGALAEGGAEGIRGLAEARKRVQDADARTREMMMNLEMSKGTDRRAARRALTNAQRARETAIADLGLRQAQLAATIRGQNMDRQAQIEAARARAQGYPAEVADKIGDLVKLRFEIQEKVMASTPYLKLESDLKEYGENTPEGKQAAASMQNMLAGSVADIEEQINNLKSGKAIVGMGGSNK